MPAEYRSEFTPRLRRKRRIFWFVFGAAVVLVVFLGGAFYALRNLDWFKVKQFTVTGTAMSETAVRQAIETSQAGGFLGSFLGPQNILYWQFRRAADAPLALPLVASLNVQTDLWARTVAVAATDRTLWSVVCEDGGARCYAIDGSGIVFAQVPDTQGVLILKITDQSGRTFVLGEPFLPSSAWIANLTATLRALQTGGYPVAGVTIDDLSTGEWHASLAAGPTMDFSFNFVPAGFQAVLAGLRSQVDLSKVTDIDFSVPQRIYYK
ncbi:hypothetical protein M1432_02135 [Patescibacteria group bacterium]|nr:hypothetical protein [Patescibacteria group bacterium]